MKEYLKPEVEYVDFAAEAIATNVGDGDVDLSIQEAPRPGQG